MRIFRGEPVSARRRRGSKGPRRLLEIDGNRLELRTRDGAREDCSVVDAADDSYHPSWFAGMATDFVLALGQGSAGPLMSENLAEAASAVALIAAARESSGDGGSWVNLARMVICHD